MLKMLIASTPSFGEIQINNQDVSFPDGKDLLKPCQGKPGCISFLKLNTEPTNFASTDTYNTGNSNSKRLLAMGAKIYIDIISVIMSEWCDTGV